MGIIWHLCCETHKIAVDMEKQYGGGGHPIEDDKLYTKDEVNWRSLMMTGQHILMKVREFLESHSDESTRPPDFKGCTLFITDDSGDEPWEVERGWSVWEWDNWDDWHIENDAERDKYWVDECGYVWVDGQGYRHPKDMGVTQPLL